MRFYKYQGLGNDFVLLERPADHRAPDLARAMCDRHFGIGADGLLFVGAPGGPAQMVVYNADGSRPEMCGNGLRCVAAHLMAASAEDTELSIQTDAGPRRVRRRGEQFEVDMGHARDDGMLTVTVDGRAFHGRVIDLGNPHFVMFDAWGADDPGCFGPTLSTHSAFPEGMNTSFAHPPVDGQVELVVHERGAGLTLACGTGACATAAAATIAYGLKLDHEPLAVALPGGTLHIAQTADGHLTMTGSAMQVFEGVWEMRS